MKKLSVILTVLILTLSGCTTNTGDVNKDRTGRVTNAILTNAAKAVGSFAASTLQNAVQQQVGGKNVDWNAAASQGLWTQAGTLVSSDDINNVISAWAGPQAPAIISAVKPSADAATTPAQVQAVAVLAANALDKTTAK